MFINLQAAYWMIGILLILMSVFVLATLSIKVTKKRKEKKEITCLENFRSYLNYLQVQLDNEEYLKKPNRRLGTFEKKVLQKTLLQWVDRLEGIHRQKLITLCKDMGLIAYNKKRLKNPWSLVRLDAVYNIGILRDDESTSTLFSILYRTKFDSSVYIIARSIAQTSKHTNQMRDLIHYLVDNGKQDIHLVADICKESSLDLRPIYVSFLHEKKAELNKVGLIGLQDQTGFDLPENVQAFLHSSDKEIRVLTAKLLITSMVLTKQDIYHYLQSPDWEIRNLFAQWIGGSKLIQYTDCLKEGIQDANWMVARTSAKSLMQLGTRGFEILCETAAGSHGDRGRDVANEFVQEELKQSIDRFSQLDDITMYNQKVHIYQKYFGKDQHLIKAI